MVNIKKNSRVEYLDQVISSPAATVSCGRAPGPGLKKLKHITKFERSGGQLARAHSPHYVVATTHDLMGWPFFDKKEASSWAASNIKEYFEIHKDWFVE